MTDLSLQLGIENYNNYGGLEMGLKKWGKRISTFVAALVLSQGINVGSKNIEYNQVQERPGYTQTLNEVSFGAKEAQAFGKSLSKVKFHSSIQNTHVTLQRAYAYYYDLADYGADGSHEAGIMNQQAAKIILGIDTKRVSDKFLDRVPGDVQQTSPIYAIMMKKCGLPIAGDDLNNLNYYFKNQVLGINAFFDRNMTQAKRFFARNIFEIASLGPHEFDLINRTTNANVQYLRDKDDRYRDESNWALADRFTELNVRQKEYIFNEIVWPHIKSKIKTASNQFNINDPNLKWKYFYYSIGLYALAENRDGDENNNLSTTYTDGSLSKNIYKIFGYGTYNSKIIGQKLR